MSAVYITTMGALWTGSGININAVEIGEDGWIYLAGIDQTYQASGLVVLAYKDGELAWSKTFRENESENSIGAFKALTLRDGILYAAGSISINFIGADLAVSGGPPVASPGDKPALNPVQAQLYSNTQTYPIYVQLSGETGEVQYAKVLSSPIVFGDDNLDSIEVDSAGDIYVAGGGWNVGSNPTDFLDGASVYFQTRKFSNVGEELWKGGIDSFPVFLDPYTQTPYVSRNGNQIIRLDPLTGADVRVYEAFQPSVPGGQGGMFKGSLFSEDESIFILAARVSDVGKQFGAVKKIDLVTGNILWEKEFGFGAESVIPHSMAFDSSGNILIGGRSIGSVEGIAGFGGTDGFLIGISAIDGSILTKEVIGSIGNESIEQVTFQPVFDQDGVLISHNLIIGGAFAVGRYSLEGTDFKDIYVITDQGFELIGNSMDNIMQGGGGDDTIFAGAGNDTINASNGDDIYDGGVGFNTAVLANNLADIELEYASDGIGYVVSGDQGKNTLFNIDKVQLSDSEYATPDLRAVAAVSARFSMTLEDVSTSATPSFFLGNETLALHYQLIDTNPKVVISGSSLSDFIALQGGGNKAVNGINGNNVIDGGVDSTFISGGSGNNTFFLDGRAPGDSWSTITDFKVGFDKATVWGWKKGISQIALIDQNGGAAGFEGLTLHFENLLPSDANDADRSTYTNSITLTGKSLSDFGVSSSEELITQINAGVSSNHFIIGQTPADEFGVHGYLHIA